MVANVKGSILIAGTGSDAGKSVIVAGLCRVLARRGVSVAPFKAQNMSLNSAVTAGGAEIGRAQAAQAFAAGIAPEAAMNPILLKPSDDRRAQVIVMGQPVAEAGAQSYVEWKPKLLQTVLDAYHDLRARFDVVVCEGAGSTTEINLRDGDLVNMGLARPTQTPVILVGDIDRGGVFASLYGTLALLEPGDQRLIAGFIINKFRGDIAILEPGLRMIEDLTARPVLGVLPWMPDLWIDAEDSLSIDPWRRRAPAALGKDTLRVAVLAFRHMSNFTDFDPLACEPGVVVSFTRSYAELIEADLVVLPGTKATVSDLADLRADGLERALRERISRARPMLGICGGYQMLGATIHDEVESGAGNVAGLDLLPVSTEFKAEKILRTPSGTAPNFGSAAVSGYEIRHGRVNRLGGQPLIATAGGEEGCVVGVTYGTSWHGILECDDFRRTFLAQVAQRAGRAWIAGDTSFARRRSEQTDRLADAIEANLDLPLLERIIEGEASEPSIVTTALAQPGKRQA